MLEVRSDTMRRAASAIPMPVVINVSMSRAISPSHPAISRCTSSIEGIRHSRSRRPPPPMAASLTGLGASVYFQRRAQPTMDFRMPLQVALVARDRPPRAASFRPLRKDFRRRCRPREHGAGDGAVTCKGWLHSRQRLHAAAGPVA